jgi:hypothetical protein
MFPLTRSFAIGAVAESLLLLTPNKKRLWALLVTALRQLSVEFHEGKRKGEA